MSAEREAHDAAPRSRPVWLTLLPVLVFAGVAGLFLFALRAGDPSRLPSALIGKPVPQFELAGVDGLKSGSGTVVPGFKTEDFKQGTISVVNVWASWCVPCAREHQQLVVLAGRGDVQLFGINYKDDPSAARRFLGRYGNPFQRVGADRNGRASVEWGLTGVPETFVVDRAGRIAFKYVGELTPYVLEKILIPAIENAGRPTS
ncbi:MAG: DsbE family thiol:disulfide interchange protein [Hyphomicrobiaceae bacterium]